MCAHSLSYHTLKSGETDTILVLEKFTYCSDTTVSEMVDIIIVSDAVLKVHVVVDGCEDIILGDVLGNKSLNIASDSTRKLLGIISVSIENLSEDRIIYSLLDSEILGIAINEVRQINHHVGENSLVLLLGLDNNILNSGILNGICKFCGYCGSCCCDYFTGKRIDYILCKDVISDTVLESHLLVELVTAYSCKVVSLGLKEKSSQIVLGVLFINDVAGADLLI